MKKKAGGRNIEEQYNNNNSFNTEELSSRVSVGLL